MTFHHAQTIMASAMFREVQNEQSEPRIQPPSTPWLERGQSVCAATPNTPATLAGVGEAVMDKEPTMTKANVTDADRAAASNYAETDGEYYVDPKDRSEFIAKTLAGELDEEPLTQAFANHRTQSTAALQAENEKLRAVLLEVEVDWDLMEQETLVDPDALVELRAICSKHGYGNIMASTSALWRHCLGEQEGGAFVAGPCVATVRNRSKQIKAALSDGEG